MIHSLFFTVLKIYKEILDGPHLGVMFPGVACLYASLLAADTLLMALCPGKLLRPQFSKAPKGVLGFKPVSVPVKVVPHLRNTQLQHFCSPWC